MPFAKHFLWWRTLIVISAGAVISCSDTSLTTPSCAAPTRPAILLSFASGVNATAVNANTIIVYQREGEDTLSIVRTSTTNAAVAIGSKPGAYDLRTITPGYADWLTTDLVVAADGCEPTTVSLIAFLQPNS
jgi:hypothetical protein